MNSSRRFSPPTKLRRPASKPNANASCCCGTNWPALTRPRHARCSRSPTRLRARVSGWLGGDGWAYDIGFGGLDHVLGSGENVKVLVLDTETYSNTGGQMSKSTPRGAVAKFAAGGKLTGKKDLAMEAVSYGSVYVARVAMGGSDAQTIKAFQEAEAYDGPALIIAYSHCIAHGYDLAQGMEQQKKAVLSGYWPLMRYNPSLRVQGKNPFQLDSRPPSIPLKDYSYNEARYTMLARSHPDVAAKLLAEAQDDVDREWRVYSARAAVAGHVGPQSHTRSRTTEGTYLDIRCWRRMIIAPNSRLSPGLWECLANRLSKQQRNHDAARGFGSCGHLENAT